MKNSSIIMHKLSEIIYFFCIKLPKILKGMIRGNLLFAYYGRYKNFGDQLTPVILDFYGFTTVYAHYKPKYKFSGKARIISVGTVLHNTPNDFDGLIVGAGSGNAILSFPMAEILAVRGKLTQSNIITPSKKIVLGDPGLLVSFIYPRAPKVIYKLGIVPHFVDKNDPIIKTYANRFGNLVKIIDVQRKPEHVINDITRCKNIISSSLHGLVVADSYNIPNIMYVIRRNIPSVHDYKYEDYYSVYGMKLDCIEVDGSETLDYFLSKVTSKNDLVNPVKLELHGLFGSLKGYLYGNARN